MFWSVAQLHNATEDWKNLANNLYQNSFFIIEKVTKNHFFTAFYGSREYETGKRLARRRAQEKFIDRKRMGRTNFLYVPLRNRRIYSEISSRFTLRGNGGQLEKGRHEIESQLFFLVCPYKLSFNSIFEFNSNFELLLSVYMNFLHNIKKGLESKIRK